MSTELLTIQQTLEYFQISRATFYRWRYSLGLPVYKIGGLVRVKKTDVEKLLESTREEVAA